MKVLIPDALRSYTDGQPMVSAVGNSVDEVLNDLERQFPGFRFRIVNEQDQLRRNIVLFAAGERTTDLRYSVGEADELVILQALAGG